MISLIGGRAAPFGHLSMWVVYICDKDRRGSLDVLAFILIFGVTDVVLIFAAVFRVGQCGWVMLTSSLQWGRRVHLLGYLTRPRSCLLRCWEMAAHQMVRGLRRDKVICSVTSTNVSKVYTAVNPARDARTYAPLFCLGMSTSVSPNSHNAVRLCLLLQVK